MPSLPDPAKAASLADARQQTHHAVQLATAAGISFLPRQADDSHTNLEWLPGLSALASRVVPAASPFRVGVRVDRLELSVLDAAGAIVVSLPLHGRAIPDAAAWLRERLTERGASAEKFTLARHYEIPHHAVDDGRPFDASDRAAFAELSAWFGLASRSLERIRAKHAGSEVRCWPHHFDIATLIDVAPGKTNGAGMEPGDESYEEPYFYVNAYPRPSADSPLPPLAGGGSWHTRGWFGAVLPSSRIGSAGDAETQIAAFLESATAASRRLLTT
jgi:hypothetical protein